MGRYYVCVGVESQSCNVRELCQEERSESSGKTGDVNEKESSCTKTTDATAAGYALKSSDILTSNKEQESHFLQENVQRFLECSGLSTLRLAPSPSGSTSWLTEPFRALSPANLLMEDTAKSCDRPKNNSSPSSCQKETEADDSSEILLNRFEESAPREHHQLEIEVEWEDPSLRDVYPFLRQGYSTERKALQNRERSENDWITENDSVVGHAHAINKSIYKTTSQAILARVMNSQWITRWFGVQR